MTTIKSLDTCNKTLKLTELKGQYSVVVQIGEEVEKITIAPDLMTAMDMFDKTEMILCKNFN